MKKSLFVIITILTFGIVTPSHLLLEYSQDVDKSEERGQPDSHASSEYRSLYAEKPSLSVHDFITEMTVEAERQALLKFGAKISPVIEEEFKQVILPNIESAIAMTAEQWPEDDLGSLAVTEVPGGGLSEKIFHIYNRSDHADIIRFHVRREHPPLDGHYFNFHYHTRHDNFQTHYALGTIYWDKNTPPKWMTV